MAKKEDPDEFIKWSTLIRRANLQYLKDLKDHHGETEYKALDHIIRKYAKEHPVKPQEKPPLP